MIKSEKGFQWLAILALVLIAIGVYKLINKNSGLKQCSVKSEFLVCADAVNVQVTKEQPEGQQKIQENCLSGIVLLPLNVNFRSDAPGWAEYWFITPDGYRVFRAKDNDPNFPRTTLPGSVFRIRGKAGMAKIQLELPSPKTRKPAVPTTYDKNRETEKEIRRIEKEIKEVKKSKKLQKKMEKLEKKLNKLK